WSFLGGARALGPVVGEGLLFGAPKMIGMSLDILSCLPRQLGTRFPQGVDVPPVAKERPPSAGPRGRRLSRWWVPYALIAPAVMLMVVFLLYPVLSVFYYSFRHHNVTQPWNNGFAGLDNFRTMLFEDPLFWDSLLFTARWGGWEVRSEEHT